MKKLIKKYKIHIIFGIIGAVAGFLYWRYIGCNSGKCPITSVWYNTSIYGIILGTLIGSTINDEIVKRKKNKIENENKSN